MNESVETTITERPVDSCKAVNGQAVHVEYLTERVTVTTEMIREAEAQCEPGNQGGAACA